MTATGWTLSELTARVAVVLDGAAYSGAPNGRVRDVPDARAIRWYATIGLVDRPAMQGRTALYGPRHLIQLVAIKRLQAQGKRIADIQAELADAPDDVLAAIADLGADDLAAEPTDDTADTTDTTAPETAKPRRRFWADPPTTHPPGIRIEPDLHEHPAESADTDTNTGLLSGLPLDGGAVLLLPGSPTTDDIAAIRAAAQPLLDLLAARGLLQHHDETKQSQPRRKQPRQSPQTTMRAMRGSAE